MEAVHCHTLCPDCHDDRDHYFCDIHGENSHHYCDIDCQKERQEKLKQHCASQVDLRPLLTSAIIDQGLLNSCSACALAVAAELYLIKDSQPFIDENASNIDASQMFVYYNERVLEDKVDLNAPVYIRDGIKSLFKNGICSEKSWPYPEIAMPAKIKEVTKTGTLAEIEQAVAQVLTNHQDEINAAINERPSEAAIKQAQKHLITRYCKLSISNGLDEVKLALSKDMPVVFGMIMPKSFYNIASDGMMKMPSPTEARLGGHAMLIVGFDDCQQHFIVRNSYGEEFADKGYCYMPYEFFTGQYQQGQEKIDNTFSYWCLTHD